MASHARVRRKEEVPASHFRPSSIRRQRIALNAQKTTAARDLEVAVCGRAERKLECFQRLQLGGGRCQEIQARNTIQSFGKMLEHGDSAENLQVEAAGAVAIWCSKREIEQSGRHSEDRRAKQITVFIHFRSVDVFKNQSLGVHDERKLQCRLEGISLIEGRQVQIELADKERVG